MAVEPINVVDLVQAIFVGLATVLAALSALFSAIAASRVKKVEVAAQALKENVALVERNTNSMTTEIARLSRKEGIDEGERLGARAGQEAARQLAEGMRKGIDTERASVAAASQVDSQLRKNGIVPVADDRTATATERIANATEKNTKDKN